MSAEAFEHANPGKSGGCCGGKGSGQTLEQLERELHALWTRIQQERARQVQPTEPVQKKGCCCG